MAANLHLVAFAVMILFGVFVAGLAYGQWSTRHIDVYHAKKPK